MTCPRCRLPDWQCECPSQTALRDVLIGMAVALLVALALLASGVWGPV